MKVCVIGGSVAGLECAINLATNHDVTVYEEHAEIGLPLKSMLRAGSTLRELSPMLKAER